MVAIDACIALIIWYPEVPCEVLDAKARVDYLLEDLERKNEKICIPAPALAELLVQAGNGGPQFINQLAKSSRFQIAPFDTKAAVEVAVAIARARKSGNKRGKGNKDNWQKVKFDHQIVAIAKVEGVSVLYSNDPGLKKFAAANDLRVISLDELPSPPSLTPLFDGVPQLENPVPEPPEATDEPLMLAAPPDEK
jgi:predicted nucleic acid-binding protein